MALPVPTGCVVGILIPGRLSGIGALKGRAMSSIQVPTPELRQALAAVRPHAAKVKTGDDMSEQRVRLVFEDAFLYVMASNSNAATTALAKVEIIEDSRGEEFTAHPPVYVVDLTPTRVAKILTAFKDKPGDVTENYQRVEFTVEGDAEYVEMLNHGGLYSTGEVIRYPLDPPADLFPDIMGITDRAINSIDGAAQADMVTGPGILDKFSAAQKQYKEPLLIKPVGSGTDQRGFVVLCGRDFIGTLESRHQDGGDRRTAALDGWRSLFPPAEPRLAVAS